MSRLSKRHPVIFSFILALFTLYIFTMLYPVALQAGQRGEYWYILIMCTSIFSILSSGQFRSASIQRREGSKFFAAINYVFGGIFVICGIIVIVSTISALTA